MSSCEELGCPEKHDAPVVTLTPVEQLLARAIAGHVVEGLEPGCAPMVIPAWVVDKLREGPGKHGAYPMQNPLYVGGAAAVFMKSHFTPDGSIYLELEVNGQRVWTGVLRGSDRGA